MYILYFDGFWISNEGIFEKVYLRVAFQAVYLIILAISHSVTIFIDHSLKCLFFIFSKMKVDGIAVIRTPYMLAYWALVLSTTRYYTSQTCRCF